MKQTHTHPHICAKGLYLGSGTPKEIHLMKRHFERKEHATTNAKTEGTFETP
jgi:hypothetical protein